MNKETLKSLLSKKWTLPQSEKIKEAIRSFGIAEKVVFYMITAIFIISGITLLYRVNDNFLVSVPASGGTISEGIIGSPRFINPVLALTDTDRDLVSLIYSGLLKPTADGTLVPDLAESYKISDDGTTYTFTLKSNLTFHDGEFLTTDDVEWTIQQILDPEIKSPKRSGWDGVVVEKIDQKTIRFILKQPYSPFLQNMTVGILPKHIWKNVDPENFLFSTFNTKPIGSGPYKLQSLLTNSSGLPVEYNLVPFKKYSLGKPFISNIHLKFFSNEKTLLDAFKNKEIESINSISPESVKTLEIKNEVIKTSPLPRIFGVFFNQNSNPIFIHKEVRIALDVALSKDDIVQSVLLGFGEKLDGPLPGDHKSEEELSSNGTSTILTQMEKARKVLEDAGWKLNNFGVYEKKVDKTTETLSFSISTSDTPELKKTASLLQESWQKLGAQVELKIFEIGDLNQNIIRPRKYEALLFGEIIGRDMDIYPFWHSSQRNDPGLNISLYTNMKVDKILEDLRKTADPSKQNELLNNFRDEIAKDTPAIFIYSPYFIYIYPEKIQNVVFGEITIPGERFINIHKWFIETNKVWKIFAK